MHLSETDIALYVEHRLSPDARTVVESHLADCPSCVEQVAALAKIDETLADHTAPELTKDVLRKAEGLVSEPRPLPTILTRSFWSPARFAFAAVLVAGVGVVYYLTTSTPERFRSDVQPPASIVLEPEDGAAIAREQLRFSWTAISSAIAYHVTLYELDGGVVWTTTTNETSLAVPLTLDLQPDAKYLWRVEALLPNDSRFRSRLNAITIAP